MKKTKVIIAGGGFAGLSAAMYLDKTLAINSNERESSYGHEAVLFCRCRFLARLFGGKWVQESISDARWRPSYFLKEAERILKAND
jgi:hypothetical protein